MLLWTAATARLGLLLSAAVAVSVLVGRSVLGYDLLGAIGDPSVVALVGLASAWVVAAAWAWWSSNQGAMTRDEAALFLDLGSDASGRVVTAAEVTEASAEAWRRDAVDLARAVEDVPRVRWGGVARALAASLLLLYAVTFVPTRASSVLTPDGIAAVFEERIEEVAELLEVLDEEVALEEEDKAALEESLARLEESIQDDPDLEATYEALDRLEAQLSTRAEEALAEAKNALESLAEAQRGADDGGNPTDSGDSQEPGGDSMLGLDPAELEDLLSELATSENQLGDAGLSRKALSELAKGAAGDLSKLSDEELSTLAAALEAAMAEPLSALEQAGLLQKGATEGALAKFKPASELPELTEEQLAMLGLCPDCGQEPCDKCEATGGT